MTASGHVCQFGPIQRWAPPSVLQTGRWDRILGASIPYRECACGETVWGVRVNSVYVLDSLAPQEPPALVGGKEQGRPAPTAAPAP